MRWWLSTDHEAFSVDNAVVSGIDISSLDPAIWMVQWQDGRGEIERQVDKDTNDNGLRETFIDVIPYAPFFQQFLAKCPRLTLTQAKKVDVDLIRQIFESKRQAPFHYPVAAGDYWWDATDETLLSSTVTAIQNATASINSVIAALNALVTNVNANIVATINHNAAVDGALVSAVNGLANEINVYVVAPHNNSVGAYNGAGAALVGYINGTMLGSNAAPPGSLAINLGLYSPDGGVTPVSGIPSDIAHCGISWANPHVATYTNTVSPGTYQNAANCTWTPLANVATSNVQWIPVGATAPVSVTPAEQAAILNGITARTNDLNVKKNIKIGQVNALTVLQDVIDYDVTDGW